MICRAIKQQGDDGHPQIVHYQKGVGSTLDAFQHLPVLSFANPQGQDVSPFEGAFGIGLEEDVRAGYGFLAHNYDRDAQDEIYLFGWSRGAYTARSIAGLVSKFGLIDKAGMDRISEVYHAYRSGWYLADASPQDKADGADLKVQLKPVAAPIQCVGVWDTVGSLGIPNLEFFGMKIPFTSEFNRKYQFHDTDLHPNIKFAFHAYASPQFQLLIQTCPERKTSAVRTDTLEIASRFANCSQAGLVPRGPRVCRRRWKGSRSLQNCTGLDD